MGMKILIEIFFFSLKKNNQTRGHEVTIVKEQCRLDIRKHSFSQTTFNEWNQLSTDCVTASSVNMLDSRSANGFLVHLLSGPLPWVAISLNLVNDG